VARQPIYDAAMDVHAYELLFRSEADDGAAGATNGADVDSANAIVATFADIGLDSLTGATRAALNVSGQFVLRHDLAELLPPERVTLDVARDAMGDDAAVYELGRLARLGFEIAIEDYADDDAGRKLLGIAQIAKLDARTRTRDEMAVMITALHEAGVRVAVAHLDDQAAYEFCRAAGADLFQGEFFCHPKTITGRGVPTNRLAQLELLAAVENPACELEDLDAVISRDLSLSYRLLRWINSAYFSLPRTVTSVREAVVLLGLRAVRNWATLITLANIEDQPSELVRTAMTRAKMAELVALGLGERDSEAYFTVGLFSALDALMNARMEDVLDSLPLGEDVRAALLSREGPMGDALSWVMAYERGRFESLGGRSPADGMLRDAYLRAIAWADETCSAVQLAA
jgi:EAL and modified HD-GYP domain-containing signal transduction protein